MFKITPLSAVLGVAAALLGYELYEKHAAAATQNGLVPTGANVTYGDGHVDTLVQPTPLSALQGAGAVSYYYNGATVAISSGVMASAPPDSSYLGDV